jgi:hypothetical protein
LFRIGPNICMVETLRVGRVFIAGGQFFPILFHLYISHVVYIDAAHCHTPAGGQV